MIAGNCYPGDLTLGTLRTLNHSLSAAALAGFCHFVNDETEKQTVQAQNRPKSPWGTQPGLQSYLSPAVLSDLLRKQLLLVCSILLGPLDQYVHSLAR